MFERIKKALKKWNDEILDFGNVLEEKDKESTTDKKEENIIAEKESLK